MHLDDFTAIRRVLTLGGKACRSEEGQGMKGAPKFWLWAGKAWPLMLAVERAGLLQGHDSHWKRSSAAPCVFSLSLGQPLTLWWGKKGGRAVVDGSWGGSQQMLRCTPVTCIRAAHLGSR